MELEQFKCEVCPHKKGWISVKDKLPKDNDWYLVTWKDKIDGFKGVPTIACYKDKWIFFECCYDENYEVIAWMPLPSPYAEDRKGGAK